MNSIDTVSGNQKCTAPRMLSRQENKLNFNFFVLVQFGPNNTSQNNYRGYICLFLSKNEFQYDHKVAHQKLFSSVTSAADVCQAPNTSSSFHHKICFAHKALFWACSTTDFHQGGHLWLQLKECSCEQGVLDSRRLCDSEQSSLCSYITVAGFLISLYERKAEAIQGQRNNVETWAISIPERTSPESTVKIQKVEKTQQFISLCHNLPHVHLL